MNNDQVTTADLDRDDLAQDVWVAMLESENRHPGKIDGLAAAGTLEGYMNQATMHAWSLRERRRHREADAESRWAASEPGFAPSPDDELDDDDVNVDVDLDEVLEGDDRRLLLWDPMVLMYDAPPVTPSVLTPEWAKFVRESVRPHGARSMTDTVGVLKSVSDWEAGHLTFEQTVKLFGPWCTARPALTPVDRFLNRVVLPDEATMESIVWVLKRLGVHADAAWNSAVGAATALRAREDRPRARPSRRMPQSLAS